MNDKKIAHLADIHIPNGVTNKSKYDEITSVLKETISSLKKNKPDRIVIVGDIFDNKLEVNNEAESLCGWFLNKLSDICKVIVTRGNHDFNAKNKNRMDSVQNVINLIDNQNVTYYNHTGFFEDDDLVWVVWHHGDNKNPWNEFDYKNKDPNKTYIDLFHNPINNAMAANGMELKNDNYISIKDFKGDKVMLGDIHLFQEFKY